jgi:hypothetical protein
MRRLKFSVRGKFVRWVRQQSGVDVMIGIFWPFLAIFGEKMALFSKTNALIKFLTKLALVLEKTRKNFC